MISNDDFFVNFPFFVLFSVQNNFINRRLFHDSFVFTNPNVEESDQSSFMVEEPKYIIRRESNPSLKLGK